MSNKNIVKLITLDADSSGSRLDRWIKKVFPGISQGTIEKWARTGQIRIDGKRVKASARLNEGQQLRLPPIPDIELFEEPKPQELSRRDKALIKSMIVFEDDDIIVLNKPAGLAVQGGSKTHQHLDGLLSAYYEKRPKIVHRLDKDTSGVMLMAKSERAAKWLANAFKDREIHKTYMALVVGRTDDREGTIKLPLQKRAGKHGEKVEVHMDGDEAITNYKVIATTKNYSLLELEPLTGRTHQIRVHCAHMGHPVLGDGKYGGKQAHPFSHRTRLHLHASSINFIDWDGNVRDYICEVPEEFENTFYITGIKKKK